MEAESNIVVQTEFPKEASTSDVVLNNKNIVRLVAYSDEESDEEMSVVEPDSTVDIAVDEGLKTKDTEQCKDEVIGENVCSSTNGGVMNGSSAIEFHEIEKRNGLVDQKDDILMSSNLDGSQCDENHGVSEQEGQQGNHFFAKSKTDVCQEMSNTCQAVDREEDGVETGKETEIVMEENRNCIFLEKPPEMSNDGICREINKTYQEVERKNKASEKETDQVIQETWNDNFPVKEPENNIAIDDSFCDMSDLAFVAEIVAQTPSTSPLKSRQPRRIKDCKENDDVLEKASQQLGKKLIAVESDSSETEDSSEDSSSSSEASSSSSTISSSSSSESSDDETDIAKIREIIDYDENQGVSLQPPKTKDEILPQELPQQPEIEIELPDDAKLDPIGEIQSYVEMMIVIKARKDTPALDAETLFFLEDRKLLGMVFDVFGPVQNPFYVIRLDKEEKFKSMGIKIGDPVFYAPNYLNMTNYVFVEQLKRMKGSDASWQHDQEPPPELLEYSDDEEEAKAKSAARKRRQNERKELESYDADADDDDVEMQNKPQRNKHRQSGTIHSDQNKQSGETAEIGSAHIESSQRPTRGRGRGRGRGTQLSLTPTHSHPLHGNLQGNNFLPRGNRPTLFHNDISQHNNESGFEQRYPAPGGPRFGSDLGCNVPPMFAPNFPPGAQSRHPEPFNGPRFRSQRAQFSPTLPRPPHDQMFRGRVHHPGYQLPGVPIHGPHPPMFDPTVPPPALNSMPPHFDSSIPPPGTLPSSFDAAVLPPVSGKARPIFDPSIPPPSVPPNMPPFNWQPPT